MSVTGFPGLDLPRSMRRYWALDAAGVVVDSPEHASWSSQPLVRMVRGS